MVITDLTLGKLGKGHIETLYYFCNFSKSLKLFFLKNYIKRVHNNIGNISSVCIPLACELEVSGLKKTSNFWCSVFS